MTRHGRARPALGSGVVSLLVIAMSPVVLLAGELVNRHYLAGRRVRPGSALPEYTWRRLGPRGLPRPRGRVRRRARRAERCARRAGSHELVAVRSTLGHRRFGPVLAAFLTNPVWIALTAPSRWILDRFRPRVGGRGGRGGNGSPGAGVREPRRPLPDLPAGAISLPEPH
jgi:hypothetical protein